MKRNKNLKELGGKIEKIKIPDKDIINWYKTLHKENFSLEEIDFILKSANKTYKKQKLSLEEKITNQVFYNIIKHFNKKFYFASYDKKFNYGKNY